MTCLSECEFVIFSETNKINRKIFHQQGNFLLVRFLCLYKENEHTTFKVIFMKYKHIFIKVFIVGTLLVIIQTMLQNMNGFLSVVNGLTKYLRPFIYAMFIAVLLNPMVEFAEKKLKFKRGLAIAMSLAALILFLTGTLLWFIPNLIDSFEEIIEKFPAFQENFNKYLEKIFAFLREKNLLLMDGEEIKQAIEDFFVKNMNNIKALLISLGLNVIDWIVEVFIILLGGFLALYFIYNTHFYTLHSRLRYCFTAYTTLPYPMYYYIA